jgi:hypothetical protein
MTESMSTGEAGREIDKRIARTVFGVTGEPWDQPPTEMSGFEDEPSPNPLPRYSTDIAAAFLVVEKLREHPDPCSRNLRLVAWCYNRTYATFDALAEGDAWTEANGEHATPLAICLAALAAIEHRPERR